jgi:hypothetical protein
MHTVIYEDHSEYSIDGVSYAKVTYNVGTVPTTGHFGFAVYQTNETKEVYDIKIE